MNRKTESIDVQMYERAQEVVGKKAVVPLRIPGFRVNINVIIKSFKISYGRERYLVAPVSGEGQMWVEKLQMA